MKSCFVILLFSLSGGLGIMFAIIKDARISIGTEIRHFPDVQTEIQCAAACSADKQCVATNLFLDTKSCKLYAAMKNPKFEDAECLGSEAVTKVTSPNECGDLTVDNIGSLESTIIQNEPNIVAYARQGVTVYNNKIKWSDFGECYEGRTHEYNGTTSKSLFGIYPLICQRWDVNNPQTVTKQPLNVIDHTTNYCRATEIDGDILCYSSALNLQVKVVKCLMFPCSACDKLTDLPAVPDNSNPGRLFAQYSPHVTFECKSHGPGESIEHCPVSTCRQNNTWSTDYSVSCSYDDCYNVSYDYKGKMSCTVSGIPCQKWNTNTPHVVGHYPRDFEDRDTNYCRDDPNKPEEAPWCYTVDIKVRFEYCPVPRCNSCDPYKAPSFPNSKRNVLFKQVTYECKSYIPGVSVDHCPVSVCEEGNQWSTNFSVSCSKEDCLGTNEYKGKVFCTTSGIPCQNWNSSWPHDVLSQPSDPDDLNSNYCRQLDGLATPWCYTTNPEVRWDYCPVQECEV